MVKKPNFFIIGAPKCGTTSLAAWLAEHPNVYMTRPKEPSYFNTDHSKWFLDSLSNYESYFSGVSSNHYAIGEASTAYLRSSVAVKNILEYSPDAKFIVGLRNPVEMAVSWHGQSIFESFENEKDFEKAWRLQEVRKCGKLIPSMCRDVSGLLYGDVCKLGEQMQRLYSQVPRERVLYYTVEEMRDYPRDVWLRILAFLELKDDGRSNFPSLNEAKNVPTPLRVAVRVYSDLKRNLGLSKFELGIIKRFKFKKRPSILSAEFIYELGDYFKEDILLLEQLTERDFSAWLRR